VNPVPAWSQHACNPHECSLSGFFEIIFNFFQKNPKVPESSAVTSFKMRRKPPLGSKRVVENNLKIFSGNPKVLQNSAVTSLDVAKKSRFAALFFDLKGMFLKTCIPQ
jgi:hypothetical protein